MKINQARSPYSQMFYAFQILLLVLFGYLYWQNQVSSVLANFHGNDFAHNYLAADLLTKGGNPYDRDQLLMAAQLHGIPQTNPYVYPLFVAVLFIPLTLFNFVTAKIIWFILNQIMWFSVLGLTVSRFPKALKQMGFILGLGMSALYYPMARTLTAGQLNIFILFVLVLAWYFYQKSNKWGAGICLCLATVIKLFPGLFLIYLILKKQWKTLGAALVLIGLLFAGGLLAWGPKPFIEYTKMVQSMNYGQSVWQDGGEVFHVSPANQSIHALIFRTLTPNPETIPWSQSPWLAKWLSTLTALIVLIIGLGAAWENHCPGMENIRISSILLTALLIPSLCWDHYLVYVLWVLLVILLTLCEHQKLSQGWITLIAIITIWTAMPFNFWSPAHRAGNGILWMSFKMYPMVIIWAALNWELWKYRHIQSPAPEAVITQKSI